MQHFPTALTAAVFLTLSGTPAIGQQSDQWLDEVVVTSSRIPLPLRRIGTSVAVLTDQDIQAHGNLSLLDVLRQMPGTGSSSSGGAGTAATLRIRGEEGFRTLTVFDGMRLSDPSLPQIGPQIEQILSAGVARVEVLRGPQGLAYGADAGGVVNLFTRQAQAGHRLELNAESGAFDTRQLDLNLSGRQGRLDYFFSAVDFSNEGFNSRASDSVLRDADGYDNTTLHGRFGIQLADNWRLDLVHREVDGSSEYDGCFAQTIVHDCLSEYELGASRLSLDYGSEQFTHQLSYAITDTGRNSVAAGQLAFANDGKLERWEYAGSASQLPGFDLVFGADLEQADSGNRRRDNAGVYLEYLSDFSDSLFLTAGLRHDDNDDFGTNTSYRGSVAYLVSLDSDARIKFRGALGTGFRAPSLYEIEYNSGPFSYPPASQGSLRQETSRGYELGVEYLAQGSFRAELVYFDQQVEDAIYFDLDLYSGYLQETGSSTSQGVELSAEVSVTEFLDLSANYTYNDAERSDGSRRARRPRNLTNLGLRYRAFNERLLFNAFYRLSGDSVDELFGAGYVALDDFAVLDLNISFQLNEYVSLFGRIENATDEDYMEITDYNAAERAFYLGVRLHF